MSSATDASGNFEGTEDCAEKLQEACDNAVVLSCIRIADEGVHLQLIS